MTHPYFMQILCSNITNQEWIRYREELKNEYKNMYGDIQSNNQINNAIKLLSTNINPNNDNMSAIHQFRYFMGFNFNEEFTGVTFDHIRLLQQRYYLVVNASYGVENNKSIVIYKNIERRKNLLLSPDDVQKMNAFIMPEKIYEQKVPYYICDNELSILDDAQIKSLDPSKKFLTLLCYNDAEKIKDCNFSACFYGNSKILSDNVISLKYLNRICNGAITNVVNNQDINVYLQEYYINALYENVKSINAFRKEYSTLQTIAKKHYNNNVERMVQSILHDPDLNGVIENKFDKDIFETYLYGINLLPSKDVNNVINYICSYISEDPP